MHLRKILNTTVCLWELVVSSKSDLLTWKNCGKKTAALLIDLLAEHGLTPNMFPELRKAICTATNTSSVVEAIWHIRTKIAQPDVGELCIAGTELRFSLNIYSLFVYVPAERVPLTDAQIAFLRKPLEGAFVRSTAMNMWLGYTTCKTVLDLALLLPNMVDDDTHVVRALRTELEHVLGPLPLQLPVEELGRIKAEKPERSYHV